MATTTLNDETLDQLEALGAAIARLTVPLVRVDYDAEVDCLYLSFRWPQETTDSEGLENGMIVDYHGDEVVGVTILDASTRGRSKKAETVFERPS